MKKFFTNSVFQFALILLAIGLQLSTVSAQSVGDYRSKNSGAWHGNAVGNLVITGGVVTGVTITHGGSGYTTAPTINTDDGGSGFAGTAVIDGTGKVTGVNITNGGTGYSAKSSIRFAATTGASTYANWEVLSNSGWVAATATPGTSVSTAKNVTIRSGHTITISNSTAYCSNLTIEAGATLTSPTSAFGQVQTMVVTGNDITTNGTLGTTGAVATVGEGIRMHLTGTPTITFAGSGTFNIGTLQIEGGITNPQEIIINQDMELRRNVAGITSLALFNGNSGSTTTKTLTISAGKTVKINGGVNSSFHAAYITFPTVNNFVSGNTQPNLTYNIEGTLDCSAAQFNLTTSTNPALTSQVVAVNVLNGGTLKLGTIARLITSVAGQKAYVNVDDGGTIDASLNGLATGANSTNSGTGGYSWFTLAAGAIMNVKALTAINTPLWIGTSNTVYNPVTLKPAATTIFTVNVKEETPAGTGIIAANKLLNKVWYLTPATTPGKTDITLGYNSTDSKGASADLASAMNIFNYNTSASSWQLASGTAAVPAAGTGTTYAVMFPEVETFNGPKFAIGNVGTLPLNLLSFSTQLQNQAVKINWTTAAEVNVKEFILERSFDGKTFVSLASLSANNTASARSYSFSDELNSLGFNTQYYRLKVVNNDATAENSNIVHINVAQLGVSAALAAFPNPMTGNTLTVNHALAGRGAKIEVLSVSGSKLLSVPVAASSTQSALTVSELAKGIYILAFYNKGEVSTISIVK